MSFKFDKKPVVENAQRTNASVFVRYNLVSLADQFKSQYEREINLTHEGTLREFLDLIESRITVSLKQEKNGNFEYSEPNHVKLTYTKSNLGKGFIVWFVCGGCGRKVRNMYFPPSDSRFLCRNCHRLSYEKQNKTKDKLVSKLLSNPDLRTKYLNSGSHKLALAAIEAQWIVNRGLEEAEKRVDKLFLKEE